MSNLLQGKKKIIGRTAAFACIIICLFMFTGCSSTKLADGYDKKTIEEKAIEIIEDVQVRGAKTVLSERMREDFVGNIDLDEMDGSVKSSVSNLGGFLTYTQKTVIGRHYDGTDEDFAVALITASYEKGEISYTLTFDKDMNLVGFYPND